MIAVRVILVNHKRLFIDLLHHGGKVGFPEIDGRFPAVAARKEEKLFYQVIHMVRLIAYGADGFVKDFFILFAPAVQHIGVTLDNCYGGAQFVGSVVDKTGLLAVAVPHPDQKVVDCGLHSDKIGILKRKGLRLAGTDVFDRILQYMIFVFGKGEPAQFIRAQGDLIDRTEDPADLPVLTEITQQETDQLQQEDGSNGDSGSY